MELSDSVIFTGGMTVEVYSFDGYDIKEKEYDLDDDENEIDLDEIYQILEYDILLDDTQVDDVDIDNLRWIKEWLDAPYNEEEIFLACMENWHYNLEKVCDILREDNYIHCEWAKDVAIHLLGEAVAGEGLNSYIASNVNWEGVIDDLTSGNTILELDNRGWVIVWN